MIENNDRMSIEQIQRLERKLDDKLDSYSMLQVDILRDACDRYMRRKGYE